jgi:tetratricopeptide (TPR) repeat protein
MPEPISTSAAIAAANIASQGINAFSTSSMNRKTREWNEAMYQKQRQDALDDWNRQTLYNSPIEQMRRLKEAGLNPNLVYGSGQAQQPAQPVRGTDIKSWNPTPPQIDMGEAVRGALSAEQSILNQQLIKANIVKTFADAGLKQKALDYYDQNFQINKEYKQAQTIFIIDDNQRKDLKNTQDIAESASRILKQAADTANTQQATKNAKIAYQNLVTDGKMKELQLMWKTMGLDNDAEFLEVLLARAVYNPEKAEIDLKNYIEAVKKVSKSGFQAVGEMGSDFLEWMKSKFGFKKN